LGAADVVESCGAKRCHTGPHLLHQVGDKRVENAVDGLGDGQLGRGGGILRENSVVESAEQGHVGADLRQGEDAGAQPVVEIGGEVGDFVGHVDELRLDGRELVQKEVRQLRVVRGGVVAGVLDNAFAHAEGEVEAAKGDITLLEPRDDAEGVQVVVEAQAECLERVVQSLFSGVAEGRVADVVGQGQGLCQLHIQAQDRGQGAGDLGDFQGVGEAAAEVVGRRIAGQAREDLGFAGQAAKGARMQDAGGIAGKGQAIGMERLGMDAAGELPVAANGNTGRQGGRRFLLIHHCEAPEGYTSGYTARGAGRAQRKALACQVPAICEP
jgi:hypothetical protein